MEISNIIKNRYVQMVLALLLGITIGALFYPTKTIEERVEQETSSQYEKKISELNSNFEKKEQQLLEKVQSEESSRKKLERTTSEKIQKLTTENRQLKESSKRQKFKLVKPDGTIIEREYEENNREEVTEIVTEVRQEFSEKIKETEDKWKKAYTERIKKVQQENRNLITKLKDKHQIEINKLVSDKKVTINEKNLSVRVGYTSDQEMRIGSSYKLWGPFSVGADIDAKPNNNPFKNSGEASIGIGFEF